MIIKRKVRVHSGITRRKPKPGRGRPAKGYDMVTKRWMK